MRTQLPLWAFVRAGLAIGEARISGATAIVFRVDAGASGSPQVSAEEARAIIAALVDDRDALRATDPEAADTVADAIDYWQALLRRLRESKNRDR